MRHAIGLTVAVAGVHGDVVEVALIREQAELIEAVPARFLFCVTEQETSEARPCQRGETATFSIHR